MTEFEKWLEKHFGIRSANDLTVENMNEIQSRALMTPDSFNDDDRSVELIIATEAAVKMPDWNRMEMVDEVLVMSGMKTRGDKDKIKYFTEHERDVRTQIGSVIDLRVENSVLLGKAIYSSVEQDLYIKTREGHTDEISAGYRPLRFEYFEVGSEAITVNGKTFQATERTLKIVWEWEIFEATLTALGADVDSGVRSEAMLFETRSFFGEPKFISTKQQRKGDSKMNLRLKQQLIAFGMDSGATDDEARTYFEGAVLRGFVYQAEDAPHAGGNADDPIDMEEVRRLTTLSQETLRQSQELLNSAQEAEADTQIRAAFEPYMEFTSTDDTINMEEIRQACLTDGDVAKANQRVLEILPSLDQPAGRSHVFANGPGETENFRTNAVAGLHVRAGVELEGDDIERGNQGRTHSLFHLADECLLRSSIDSRGWDKLTIVTRALATTDDFPAILAAAVNKSLSKGYQDAPQTWKEFAAKRNMADFKNHSITKMGQSGHLPKVLDGERIPNYAPDDSKEQMILETFGKIIAITRHAIINDDLSAFDRLPNQHARAYARTINRLAIYVLLRNANLLDTFALFSTDHKNLQSGLGAPSTVAIARNTIKKMTTLLRQQLDLDGESPLDLPPVLVLAGTTHEFTLREAMFETRKAQDNTDVAITSLNLGLAIDPYIDLSNTEEGITGTPDSLYMFTNPIDNPVVEVGFLDGNEAPRIEQRMGFDIEGMELKVAGDIAAAATDFRGAVKSVV